MIVDIGVEGGMDELEGLVKEKVAQGTKNMARGPAMSAEEMYAALEVGIDLARHAADNGSKLIGTGEMGIGNTTAASAITAVLTGRPVSDVTGRGTGVDDAGLRRRFKRSSAR